MTHVSGEATVFGPGGELLPFVTTNPSAVSTRLFVGVVSTRGDDVLWGSMFDFGLGFSLVDLELFHFVGFRLESVYRPVYGLFCLY